MPQGAEIHYVKEQEESHRCRTIGNRNERFFYKCEPLIKKFSERQDYHYCEFDSHAPLRNPHEQDHGHYTVFNVDACPKTLEIRVCQATLDYTKFLANLQFADCVVGYIQRGGNAFLRTKSCPQIWGDFIEYAKRSKQYQILTNYLLKHAITGNEKIEVEKIFEKKGRDK